MLSLRRRTRYEKLLREHSFHITVLLMCLSRTLTEFFTDQVFRNCEKQAIHRAFGLNTVSVLMRSSLTGFVLMERLKVTVRLKIR